MKRTIIICSLFVCIAGLAHSQQTFQRAYYVDTGEVLTTGYNVQVVRQTADGGYVLAGARGVGIEYVNAFMIKTDVNGDTLWTRTYYDGTGVYDVQETSDGGFVIASWAPAASWSKNALVIKTDANGDIEWSNFYGTTNPPLNGSCYANAITLTDDGGYLIAGGTGAFSQGMQDVYLVKITAGGAFSWGKSYGGVDNEYAQSVAQTPDGGYIAAGFTGGFGAGVNDAFLLKTDASGNMEWCNAYGGPTTDYGDYVEVTSDSGYILVGRTFSFGTGYYDIMCIKTDAAGAVEWARTFGDSAQETVGCVRQTSDGGYVIAGALGNTQTGDYEAMVIKLDNTGSTEWMMAYPDNYGNFTEYIEETTDGGYVIARQTQDSTIGYVYMPVLMKSDANGNTGCDSAFTFISVTSPTVTVTAAAMIQGTGGVSGADSGDQVAAALGSKNYCGTTGIEEVELRNDISVYPNPVSSFAVIELDDGGRLGSLALYSIDGRLLLEEQSLSGSSFLLDRGEQPSGLYLLVITSEEGVVYRRKILFD